MQIPDNILALIEKYQNGTASPEEKLQLDEWYHSFDGEEAAIEVADSEADPAFLLGEKIKARVLATIQQSDELPVVKPKPNWQIPAAAAIILVVLSLGIYFASVPETHQKETASVAQPKPANDVLPGGNKAMLTLADGSSIVLDSASTGIISLQGGSSVQKLKNGLVAYTLQGSPVAQHTAVVYNTISTPRGGQYQITLADGTMVWLNAASSIRFPVVFSGSERTVEITGEAYFEVAKNKDMPFKVKAASAEIEVLGTHFNVNAYDDEPSLNTTLLEGAVKISTLASGGSQVSKYLKPGQQAGISKAGKITVTDNADTEEAVAWKNGRFQYNGTDLKTILRQIARWYDVDVEYKGEIDLHCTGQLTRNENVSRVFEKLALTEAVQIKIEGKKIIISK